MFISTSLLLNFWWSVDTVVRSSNIWIPVISMFLHVPSDVRKERMFVSLISSIDIDTEIFVCPCFFRRKTPFKREDSTSTFPYLLTSFLNFIAISENPIWITIVSIIWFVGQGILYFPSFSMVWFHLCIQRKTWNSDACCLVFFKSLDFSSTCVFFRRFPIHQEESIWLSIVFRKFSSSVIIWSVYEFWDTLLSFISVIILSWMSKSVMKQTTLHHPLLLAMALIFGVCNVAHLSI